jgi:hypothetical protein
MTAVNMTFSNFLQRAWLPQLALAVAALVVYAASVSNGFVFFDDDKAILYNKALQSPSLGKVFQGAKTWACTRHSLGLPTGLAKVFLVKKHGDTTCLGFCFTH